MATATAPGTAVPCPCAPSGNSMVLQGTADPLRGGHGEWAVPLAPSQSPRRLPTASSLPRSRGGHSWLRGAEGRGQGPARCREGAAHAGSTADPSPLPETNSLSCTATSVYCKEKGVERLDTKIGPQNPKRLPGTGVWSSGWSGLQLPALSTLGVSCGTPGSSSWPPARCSPGRARCLGSEPARGRCPSSKDSFTAASP